MIHFNRIKIIQPKVLCILSILRFKYATQHRNRSCSNLRIDKYDQSNTQPILSINIYSVLPEI